MNDIEKLALQSGVIYLHLSKDKNSPKLLSFDKVGLKQFAEAYAAKVLEDKERETAELKKDLILVDTLYRQFCSNINDLREALNQIGLEGYKDQSDLNTIRKVIEISKQALSKTPAQSLQEHDNEVIEKCAKVCDEIGKRDQFTRITASAFAHEIRTLKEKQ